MSQQKRLPSLDGIRAICILLVLGAHAAGIGIGFPESLKAPSRFVFDGPLGVRIFFVLSGFLITHILLREEDKMGQVSLRAFYARRAIRILPVALAFIGTLALLDLFTGLEMTTCQYVADLTYVRNFACGDAPHGIIDSHLWSLSVEEQFYLIWPAAVALGALRWRWIAAAAMIMLAPVARVVYYLAEKDQPLVHLFFSRHSFFTQMDSLMIGCVVALLFKAYPQRADQILHCRPAWGRAIAVLTIYGVLVSQRVFFLPELILPFGPTLQALAAAYLIASYSFVRQGIGYHLLNLRPVAYVGVLSYSLYIWQEPFIVKPYVYGLAEAPLLLVFPFNILAAFGVAMLSYHALEMPLLGLRARLRREEGVPKPQPMAASAPAATQGELMASVAPAKTP